MKITALKPQVKNPSRYSIFVDGDYSFSLSTDALLDSKIVNGQELTPQDVLSLKQLSTDDKIYNRVLGYLALRPRSIWEVSTYLQRKEAGPELIESIIDKLTKLELLNDQKFADAYVRDRRLLKPTSRRKLTMELQKKHVSSAIIQEAIGNEPNDERNALHELVERKRKQSRYQDDLKLMQYLAGQGFGYGDIKAALRLDQEDY